MKIIKQLMFIITALIAIIFIQCTFTVFAEAKYSEYTYEEWNSILLGDGFYYVDDGYDVQYTKSASDNINFMGWIKIYRKNIDGYVLDFSTNYAGNFKCKIPNSYKSESSKKSPVYVKCIDGSCAFKEFDLDPKNKYMKVIDNVVFSKDGETLMSYAQYDDRTVYEIPDGTSIIALGALGWSKNLVEVVMPNSIKEIKAAAFANIEPLKKINIPPLVEELPDWSFAYCDNLTEVYIPKDSKLKKIGDHVFADSNIKELTLPSFDIEIGSMAFLGPVGHVDTHFYEVTENLKLKSYVKPEVKALTSEGVQKLTWDKIPKTTRYEVYQKMKDGSYKLIKETTGTALKLNNIKKGKQYTFAVKPIAEIRALNTSVYVDQDYEFYYTIEGTMSDDLTFSAK